MKQILYFLVFSIFTITLQGQQFKNNIANPSIGTSAYSQQQTNVFASHSNIAAIGNIKQASIGITGEQRFGLSQLANYEVHTVFTTNGGNFGIQANKFGDASFSETQFGLGYGRKLGKLVTIGGRVNYYTQQIATYGKSGTVNAEAGMLLQLTPKLTSGISVFNPVGGKFGINQTEQLDAIYKFGLGYDVSTKVAISSEIVKQQNAALNFIGAMQYQFEQKFYAKVGVSTAAANFFTSVGLSLNNQFRLEFSASHHQQLGFTPGLNILYNFFATPKP